MNDDAAPPAASWVSPLDRLWRLLAWPRLTVILLVWLAAILALSALIPQAPPNVADPVVRSQWLATVPIKVSPAVERLYSLGIFNLLDTVWLRLPLALLLAHALVALASWLPALWHRVWGSPDEMRPLGKSFHLEQDWAAPVEEVRQGITDRLEKAGYHIVVSREKATSGEDQKPFTASRWKWSWLGLAGIYLGLGLASAGLILQGWLGQDQELHLAPDVPTLLPVRASSTPALVLEGVTVTGVDHLQPVTGVALVRVSTGVGEGQPGRAAGCSPGRCLALQHTRQPRFAPCIQSLR